MSLTKEQIETNVDAYRHWLSGGKVQYYDGMVWFDAKGFGGANVILYRKKPGPILRPWTMDEAPLGAIFRHIVNNLPVAWVYTNLDVIRLANGLCIKFRDLALAWQYTIDRGATWHPCGVMEESK